MVISVITNGIGNQLYDFFLGYLFAKRYHRKLMLAVCSDYGRFDRYNILRELSIPEVDIIRYDNRFLPHKSKECSEAIEKGIKDYLGLDSVKILGTEDFIFDSDWHLMDQTVLDREKVLVLNPQSYSQMGFLWTNRELLAPFFHLKDEGEALRQFEMHLPKNAVAVHVRASMQIREIGEENAKMYFRTAIEWYRQNFTDTGFYIFSNEMELAREWIGQAEDITYIQPHGRGVRGDLEELMCMAMMPHKILSHGSTYSEMALVFGPQSGNTYIQGISPRGTYYKSLLRNNRDSRRFITREHIKTLGEQFSYVAFGKSLEKTTRVSAGALNAGVKQSVLKAGTKGTDLPKHFIIFLSHHSFTDSLDVLEQVGLVLRQQGHKVSFIFKASKLMEDEFATLSWRYRGEDFGGCEFFYYERITATGSLESFLEDILLQDGYENILLYKGAEPMICELIHNDDPQLHRISKKICLDDYDWQCEYSDGILAHMDVDMQKRFMGWSDILWNGLNPESPFHKRAMFTKVSNSWNLEEQSRIPEDILDLARALCD